MNAIAIKLCRVIWSFTPILAVRKFYLDVFMKTVRGKTITRTVEGMTFELDLAENIDVCILLEKFERDVVETIERYCRPGWRVLDIGANIGAHTIRLAKKVGAEGMVHAFEPTDYAYRKLLRNVSLNGSCQVSTHRLALWNQNKDNQPIRVRSSWQTDGTSVSGSCTVDFVRLDDWCEKHGVRHVDMIKIDVDGNEFPVFDGGRKLLAACRPLIIMEVGAWHFADPDTNVISLLVELGYRFWDVKTHGEYCRPEDMRRLLPAEDKGMSFSINVIAAPNLPAIGVFSSDVDQ